MKKIFLIAVWLCIQSLCVVAQSEDRERFYGLATSISYGNTSGTFQNVAFSRVVNGKEATIENSANLKVRGSQIQSVTEVYTNHLYINASFQLASNLSGTVPNWIDTKGNINAAQPEVDVFFKRSFYDIRLAYGGYLKRGKGKVGLMGGLGYRFSGLYFTSEPSKRGNFLGNELTTGGGFSNEKKEYYNNASTIHRYHADRIGGGGLTINLNTLYSPAHNVMVRLTYLMAGFNPRKLYTLRGYERTIELYGMFTNKSHNFGLTCSVVYQNLGTQGENEHGGTTLHFLPTSKFDNLQVLVGLNFTGLLSGAGKLLGVAQYAGRIINYKK